MQSKQLEKIYEKFEKEQLKEFMVDFMDGMMYWDSDITEKDVWENNISDEDFIEALTYYGFEEDETGAINRLADLINIKYYNGLPQLSDFPVLNSITVNIPQEEYNMEVENALTDFKKYIGEKFDFERPDELEIIVAGRSGKHILINSKHREDLFIIVLNYNEIVSIYNQFENEFIENINKNTAI